MGIQGIRSGKDYKNITRYLAHLNGIQHIEVKEIRGNTALFEVIPLGMQGKAMFAQMLNAEQRLIAPAIPHTAFAKADLVYEWEP